MTVDMRRARSLIGGLVTAHAPFRQSGRSHSLVWFVLLVVCAQAITYFVVGALAFATLTHGLYEGPDPLFGSYLRTPSETELWRQVTLWFLPAQLFRGILMGLALRPFVPLLRRWSVWRRTVAITGLYVTMGFWAAAVAAPGNIEGLVYLRPEFSLDVALLVQPEIVVQGAAMALLVALGLGRRSAPEHANRRSPGIGRVRRRPTAGRSTRST